MKNTLTEEQIATYRKDGFIIIEDFDNIKEYEIFDSMGKKVAIIESRKTDVTDFENGIYFIKLNGNPLKRFSVIK